MTQQHNAEIVRARGSAVEALYERGVTWVAFQPIPDLLGGIDFAIRKLPGLGILAGTVEGVRHQHVQEDDDNDFSFHLNLSGISTVAARGRETLLRDGDAMLLTYTESRIITRPAPVYHLVLRLPRSSLHPLVRNIDDAVLRPIPRGTGPLGLLSHYAGALMDEPALAVPETRQLIATQLCDLIAVTIGATRDGIALAEGRGIRAARLRALKGDIEARLTEPDLSASTLAMRHRISESYVRKLFESEGASFSEFVLHRRLVRAHRMLSDWRAEERGIMRIAFECGFGDLSYFNRTFKRLYGATPSEVRAATDREQL